MDFISLLSGAAAGALVGFLIAWARGKQQLADAVPRHEFDQLAHEKTQIVTKLESAQQTLTETQRERTAYSERAITAEAQNKALAQQLKDQQEQLKAEFNNVATDIMKKVSTDFAGQSEKQIGTLLDPMKLKLNEFQELVTKSFGEQGKETHTLKAEIEKIVLQADGLTKALRGDVKAQGNWGEVMLERILEESGLRRGEDYVVQGTETGESGSRQRPDVVIKLPDGKHIVIDSKVSLNAYDRFCTDEGGREMHLKEFLRSVKAHVNGLEQKRYQDIAALGTPDFVLMFMPIEGAYSLAVQQDGELHAAAWNKRIVIVCPSTLFATLQTVASLWKIERQNANAQMIAAEAGKMYDKFVGFIEDMNSIGNRINQLQNTYDDAMGKLSTGRGSLVGRAEKLKELDVRAAKTLSIRSDDAEEETPALELVAEA